MYNGALNWPSGRNYYDSSRGHLAYDQVWGDITLTADFSRDVLTGLVDNIRVKVHGPSVTQSRPDTQLSIASGTISESSFLADVVGSGYFEGYTGDVIGAFYGSGAEESGGVITAQGGPNDVFLASFGSERTGTSYLPDVDAGTVNSAMVRHSALLLEAMAIAAQATPNFGSVTQSSNTRDFFRGGTTDRVSTRFDGNQLSVRVARTDRADLHFKASGFSGDGTRRTRSTTGDGLSIAFLRVASTDPTTHPSSTDYLSFGTWLHLTGDLDTLRFNAAEVGSFADLSDQIVGSTSWASGGATYKGTARGIYGILYGTGIDDIALGSHEIGTFKGHAQLNARFTSASGGSIEGCFGCGRPVDIDGVFVDSSTNEEEDIDISSTAFSVAFPETEFDETGKFTGNLISVRTPHVSLPGGDSFANIGSYGGAFYGQSRFLSGAFPGNVVGTFGAEGTTAGGTRAAILGSFSGRAGPFEF